MMDPTDVFGAPIHVYTRNEALEDGALVEVDPDVSREAGFTAPVHLTRAVFEHLVEWTDDDEERSAYPQEVAGRLWDLLWMTRTAATRAGGEQSSVTVVLWVRKRPTMNVPPSPRRGHGGLYRVGLRATIGPDDDGAPVFTVAYPDDD